MRSTAPRLAAAVMLAGVPLLTAVPSRAQLMDTLKNAAGGQTGALGGMGLPSVGGASTSNIAGVLEYCVQNKLVSGAGSAESALLGKLGGPAKESHDPAYTSGSGGVLQSGGKGFDLNSLGDTLKQKLCDQVLAHAKSLL